ncbi:helix-turn-helix domain-containing protein [Bifidobacterium magnum]|uniref:DNA-binding protein n=1 Tax=Bifidobacterium magnum TaxID=1692 RepID=A0A087B9Q0_9BIFI|nr:helix-turn-helix transcriptional regulator [Bifidobacterium magnum]KFI67750.1 DNA-binding protein [Bifidobacterium magnum]
MDMNTAMAKALQARRAVVGITLRELSARAGIPSTTLDRIMHGTRNINVINLHKLAQAMNVTVPDLFEDAQKIIDRDQNSHIKETENAIAQNLGLAAYEDDNKENYFEDGWSEPA